MLEQYITILTTTPTRKIAKKITALLLGQKLAACVQIIGPMESHYRWQGKIKKAKEWLCIIKSTKRKLKRIEMTIKANHPYYVPQIIAIPILAGSKEYLDWVGKAVTAKS